MPDYVEVTSGFNLERALSDDSWTGTRIFKQADNPSTSMAGNVIAEGSLPVPGDLWPASRDFGLTIPANFVCRKVTYELEGGDFTKNRLIICSYSTADENTDNQPDNSADSESLTISSTLRRLPIAKSANGELPVDAAGNVLREITAREVNAQYTYNAVGFTTLQLAAASGSASGKVLNTGDDVTNWLSLGTAVTQYREENTTLFRASRSYAYKLITAPKMNGIDEDGWQAMWDEKQLKCVKANNMDLYEEVAAFVDTMPTIQ